MKELLPLSRASMILAQIVLNSFRYSQAFLQSGNLVKALNHILQSPMFGSFAGMLQKIKENKTVQSLAGNISENYAKLKGQMLIKFEVIEVLPQIYHIPFPESENISQLQSHIGSSEFQIWNVGEYSYDAAVERDLLKVPEQGEVHHLCFTMYSNLPFYELVLALNTIRRFIEGSRSNKVYVHCQDGRIRSGLLLACYIYRHRLCDVEDIGEAMLFINKALKVCLEQPEGKMHKNLHLLLKNFVNYLNNFHSINPMQLQLLKIIINNPPRLQVSGKIITDEMRISIEIKCGESTILKNLYNSDIIEACILCVSFDKKNLLLSDEFLLIVKYVVGGKAYNILRIQLNTNFIYQCFTRVQQQDIDTSDFALLNHDAIMHVDFMFQQTTHYSKLAKLEQGGLEEEKQEKQEKKEKQEKPEKEEAEEAVIAQGQELDAAKRVIKQEAARVESEQAHQQAIASLQQEVHNIVDQESTTIDLQEINQKIILALKVPTEKQQAQKKGEEEEEEDLDDYLSKLQSQA